MTNTDAVKGFKDYTGEEAIKREEIRKILVGTFENYGFEPAETPIIEYEEFVKGDNKHDEAVSDIFRLEDKGKRKLALRYEFTFQLKRIMQNKKLPYKRYQIGPVFRDEPISANRFRQFIACDADIIGSDIKDEAEILAIIKTILEKLGINFIIYFNNRKLLNEILDKYKVKENNKDDVIRELDKLDKISEEEVKKGLKKYNAEKIIDILKNKESFFEKFSNYKEVEELKRYCKYYGVEVKFLPMLARGLSYYNGNVFEVKSSIKETICGGGSFMFNGVQATGFGTGLERLEILSNLKNEKERFLIVSLGKDKKAIELAEKFREKNKIISIYYGKPSKALDYANAYNFNKVIFVGEKEVKSKKFKIKDMKTGKESLLNI
ncbi:MAG: ATP phosphoribosyltransferase regulatory subunit [Candidatus Pacearchaeota archaeon]